MRTLLIIVSVILVFCDWNANNAVFVEGVKPRCSGNLPNPKELFRYTHQGEVGYVRDVCVELARELHTRLKLTEENKLCTELANIRTSSRVLLIGWWSKWKRSDPKYAAASTEIMNKAVSMMHDFNNHISQVHSIKNIQEQGTFLYEIDATILRLTASGAATEDSPIIKEIQNLRGTFCSNFLEQEANKQNEEKNRLEAETEEGEGQVGASVGT